MERAWTGGEKPYILPIIFVSFLEKWRPFLDRFKKKKDKDSHFYFTNNTMNILFIKFPTIYRFANGEFYI